MPWIKLHVSMLGDHKIRSMTPSEGWIWVNLLLIAGESDNKIAHDRRWIAARLPLDNFKKRLDLQYLWDLGLIEEWTAGLDKRREEKKRADGDQHAKRSSSKRQKYLKIMEDLRKGVASPELATRSLSDPKEAGEEW